MSRRRARPSRDPDRRPTPPKHPGFAQFPLDVDTDVCVRCKALVPATDLARIKHQERDEQIDAAVAWLATTALTEQLSKTAGSGSTPQDPGPAPPSEAGTAGGGGRDGPTGRGPASDTTSPTARGGARPTGPREPAGSGAATPGTTAGAEVRPERTSLAHQGRVGASAPDPKSPPTPPQEAPLSRGGVEGANVPPGSQAPPGPGGTNGAGRGGRAREAEPRPADPEQASLAAWERQHADERDHRWWTQ